jgi:O-antigen ligase
MQRGPEPRPQPGGLLDGWFAPVVLAVSLNGFFLYLGALDLVNVRPRTPLTLTWYGLMGVAAIAATIPHRRVLRDRLRAHSRVVATALAAGAALAVWFTADALLVERSTLSTHFAGQLVIWSLPTALLAFSLPTSLGDRAARGIAALGLVFLVIEAEALIRQSGHVQRFSPIAHLDPISTGAVCALGAVGVACIHVTGRRQVVVQIALGISLLAGSAVSGSRGPVLAAVVGCVGVALVGTQRARVAAALMLVVGLGAGSLLAHWTGTFAYLTDSVNGSGGQPAISTFHIRFEWLRSALEQAPHRPLFGHGIAQFVDNTPEAHRMGVAGERIYPHNTFAEAAFSLGLLGLVPFLALAAAAAVALACVMKARVSGAAVCAGLAGFAIVSTSVSGEIGADAVAWAAAALTLGVYAERLRESRRASMPTGNGSVNSGPT